MKRPANLLDVLAGGWAASTSMAVIWFQAARHGWSLSSAGLAFGLVTALAFPLCRLAVFRVLVARSAALPRALGLGVVVGSFVLGAVLSVSLGLSHPGFASTHVSLHAGVLEGLFTTLCIISITFLVLLAVLMPLGRPANERPAERGRISWMAYAAPCALVWSAYLAAFWPGIMSSDSVDQFQQAISGHYANIHPIFHTWTNALLLHLVRSPAMIAETQVLALAATFGFAIRELEVWRVPAPVRWLAVLVFALTPVNGALSITLWKDVFFTVAVLGLTALLLRVVLEPEQALRHRATLLGLATAAAAVALYRQNGVLVIGAMCLLLPAAVTPGLRLRAFATMATGMVAYAVVVGPACRIARVAPMTKLFALQVQIHQLGAIVVADPALPQRSLDFLEKIEPLETWKSAYNCYTSNPLIYDPSMHMDFVERHFDEIIAEWLGLLSSHLTVIARHQLCVTSLVWRIHPPAGAYLFAYGDGIAPNALGLVQASKAPHLKEWLLRLLHASEGPSFIDWVWRPALYLYFVLLVGAVVALRLGRVSGLMVIAPAALNAATLMALNLSQDFRYEYPVFACAFALFPLTFAKVAGGKRGDDFSGESTRHDDARSGGEADVCGEGSAGMPGVR